jgi:hypothetical protein
VSAPTCHVRAGLNYTFAVDLMPNLADADDRTLPVRTQHNRPDVGSDRRAIVGPTRHRLPDRLVPFPRQREHPAGVMRDHLSGDEMVS